MIWYELEKEVFGLTNRELSDKLVHECLTSLMYLRQLDYLGEVDVRPIARTELNELGTLFERASRELGG